MSGMCIRAGNNSSVQKNRSLLPTAEFFIVMWCIQGPNVERGNKTETEKNMLYLPPQCDETWSEQQRGWLMMCWVLVSLLLQKLSMDYNQGIHSDF